MSGLSQKGGLGCHRVSSHCGHFGALPRSKVRVQMRGPFPTSRAPTLNRPYLPCFSATVSVLSSYRQDLSSRALFSSLARPSEAADDTLDMGNLVYVTCLHTLHTYHSNSRHRTISFFVHFTTNLMSSLLSRACSGDDRASVNPAVDCFSSTPSTCNTFEENENSHSAKLQPSQTRQSLGQPALHIVCYSPEHSAYGIYGHTMQAADSWQPLLFSASFLDLWVPGTILRKTP